MCAELTLMNRARGAFGNAYTHFSSVIDRCLCPQSPLYCMVPHSLHTHTHTHTQALKRWAHTCANCTPPMWWRARALNHHRVVHFEHGMRVTARNSARQHTAHFSLINIPCFDKEQTGAQMKQEKKKTRYEERRKTPNTPGTHSAQALAWPQAAGAALLFGGGFVLTSAHTYTR